MARLGPDGTISSGRVWAIPAPVQAGGGGPLHVYYVGQNSNEEGRVDPSLPAGSLARAAVLVARTRPDGLTCAQSGYSGGRLTTQTFHLPANASVTLNADTGAGGTIYVELQVMTMHAADASLRGLGAAAVIGNGVALPVEWEHALVHSAGVRLLFTFQSAVQLFSFTVHASRP